jgi:hypothetical protein
MRLTPTRKQRALAALRQRGGGDAIDGDEEALEECLIAEDLASDQATADAPTQIGNPPPGRPRRLARLAAVFVAKGEATRNFLAGRLARPAERWQLSSGHPVVEAEERQTRRWRRHARSTRSRRSRRARPPSPSVPEQRSSSQRARAAAATSGVTSPVPEAS